MAGPAQGYIGRNPGDSQISIAKQTFEPTGVQSNFTFSSGYTVGFLDVYFNGSRLIHTNDYTAADGSTVGLTTSANSGDVIECVAYKAFNVNNVNSTTGNFTVGNNLTVDGNLTVTGDTTLAAGTSVSYATTAFNLEPGVWTNTDTTESTNSLTGALVVSGGVGIAKSLHVGGNISVGGTLTYEDVTNQDVIGLATFRSGVQFGVAGVGGTITGVGNAILSGITTVGTALSLADDVEARFGDAGDLRIYHDGSNSYIHDGGTGDLKIQGASDVVIEDTSGSNSAVFNTDGAVELYYRGAANPGKKLETTTSGITVTGIVTATSFSGIAATSTVSTTDLYVVGVSTVVGFCTFQNNVHVGRNIDVVGVSTLAGDIKVSGASTFSSKATFDQGIFLNGNNPSREKIYTAGTALNGEFDLLLEDGSVWYLTANATGTFIPDIKVASGTSLDSKMSNNEAIVVTLIHGTNNTSYYANGFKIDDTSVTPEYVGGAPSEAGSDGYDCYTYTIIKTGSATFKVFANLTNFT